MEFDRPGHIARFKTHESAASQEGEITRQQSRVSLALIFENCYLQDKHTIGSC